MPPAKNQYHCLFSEGAKVYFAHLPEAFSSCGLQHPHILLFFCIFLFQKALPGKLLSFISTLRPADRSAW